MYNIDDHERKHWRRVMVKLSHIQQARHAPISSRGDAGGDADAALFEGRSERERDHVRRLQDSRMFRELGGVTVPESLLAHRRSVVDTSEALSWKTPRRSS